MTKKKTAPKKLLKIEKNQLYIFIDNLPLSLGLSTAITSVYLVFLLLVEQFSLNFIIPGIILIVLTSFYFLNKHLKPIANGSVKEIRLFNMVALVFVILWTVFNLFYTSQNIYKYRDPAVYNITAKWLINHNNLDIPSDNTLVDESNYGFKNSSPAFHEAPGEGGRLYAQGLHVLPAISATIGRVFNDVAAFKVNIGLASLALLAMYGFAKIFILPRFAFLGMTLLSVTLPFLYFSRDMFTEPLLMLFIFSGLIAIYHAMKTNKSYLWVISGILFGSSTLARIDSYLVFLGLFIFFALYIASSNKKQWDTRFKNIKWFVISAFAVCVFGILDLTQLSKYYFHTAQNELTPMFLALLTVFAAATVFVFISKRTKIFRFLEKSTKRWRLVAAIIFIIFIALIVSIKPLFLGSNELYKVQESAAFQATILIKNSISTTSVSSTVWLSWYIGIPTLILGFIGILLMTKNSFKSDKYLIPFLIIFISVATLYLYSPKITPDHVWAMRRFLPVILPSIIIASLYTIQFLYLKVNNKISKIVFILFVVLVLFIPVLYRSRFYIFERTHIPSLTQINGLCNSLPENATVMLAGTLSLVGVQTVRTYCDVQTHGFNGLLSTEAYLDFYKFAQEQGKTPIVAFYFNEHGVTTPNSIASRLGDYQFYDIEKVIDAPPTKMHVGNQEITAGVLTSNGDLIPLEY